MARAVSLARSLSIPNLGNPLSGDLGASAVTTYLLDTFTDTNGTVLTSHTMDIGPGWTNDSAFFDIQGNATREQFGTAGCVYSNAGVASGVYRVTVSAAGGFMALRVTDSNNMIFAVNSNSTTLTLTRREAGADTVIISNASLSTISYPATFVITISGNNFTVLEQGTGQSIAGSDAFNASATRFGFRAQTALITYDNFSFRSA